MDGQEPVGVGLLWGQGEPWEEDDVQDGIGVAPVQRYYREPLPPDGVGNKRGVR